MELPKADELKGLASLLAPGLIILWFRQRVTVGPVPKLEERALAYACISSIYYAAAHPVLQYWGPRWHWNPTFTVFVEYLALPVAIGIAVAATANRVWTDRFWRAIGLQPVHHIPTAWDYVFSDLSSEQFILVTLTDGSQVAGLFGRGSFASSNEGERDLLIASVWDITESGWTEPGERRSVLLCGKDIKCVEFLRADET
jgi:hypothetical protein